MYVFGHVGLTLGAALLGSGAYDLVSTRFRKNDSSQKTNSEAPGTETLTKPDFSPVSWTRTLGRLVDIRFLLIGSMLPDIIDKPLGHAFFSNGRIISHTLLFTTILLILGIFLYLNYKNKWMLGLGIGSLAHLIMDSMWSTPRTLFWPVFGWLFPRHEAEDWLEVWINNLNLTSVYVPEIIGGAIVLVFIAMIVYERKTATLLRKGTI
jgi:inner membrane protein